ncbi:uncharacterized protein Z519_03073 [Cladophialophora bantiana CBS 173.52]|uniref:DUF1989 domain-containing protein n=1 Tax=Cladophialophora bantiana (strain ATCC 10958 / CBS 173.52 / CDC B-1940 / NIH 8579) TaxID=1442370 RepID=A0A0D2GBY5_CLAB1|nr:uncharacterized protein Z519_03073 [Cladophialophora bantiana CBS 173.52]KIW96007.1 hypothetical protein Z519_03073 [Cladophialophora bantiana CBS 173.52]
MTRKIHEQRPVARGQVAQGHATADPPDIDVPSKSKRNQSSALRPAWETLLVIHPRSKLKTHLVPAAHGHAFEVKASSHFRIVDLHGQQVVDFMAWTLPYSPATNPEHFSTSYTRYALGGSAPPQVGEALYTNQDRKMFTIVADMVKTHDLLFMACNPGFYARRGQPIHRSCATNVAEAMKPWGMEHWSEVVDPFNIFQNTPYYTIKALNCSKPGDFIEMRAEVDAVCAVSSCPFEGDGFNGGRATDIAVVIEVDEEDDEGKE